MKVICIYAHGFKTKNINTDNSKACHWTRTCFNWTRLQFSQLHINIIVNLTYLYGTTNNSRLDLLVLLWIWTFNLSWLTYTAILKFGDSSSYCFALYNKLITSSILLRSKYFPKWKRAIANPVTLAIYIPDATLFRIRGCPKSPGRKFVECCKPNMTSWKP